MNKLERKITFSNYFNHTCATFKACKVPRRDCDYKSNSCSKYWYGENKKGKYVIRLSGHWIRNNHESRACEKIASCQWQIVGRSTRVNEENCAFNVKMSGKCYLNSFHNI